MAVTRELQLQVVAGDGGTMVGRALPGAHLPAHALSSGFHLGHLPVQSERHIFVARLGYPFCGASLCIGHLHGSQSQMVGAHGVMAEHHQLPVIAHHGRISCPFGVGQPLALAAVQRHTLQSLVAHRGDESKPSVAAYASRAYISWLRTAHLLHLDGSEHLSHGQLGQQSCHYPEFSHIVSSLVYSMSNQPS